MRLETAYLVISSVPFSLEKTAPLPILPFREYPVGTTLQTSWGIPKAPWSLLAASGSLQPQKTTNGTKQRGAWVFLLGYGLGSWGEVCGLTDRILWS